MPQESDRPDERPANDFADQASEQSVGLLREMLDLVRHNRKWWLLPVVGLLLVIGLIVVIGGTVAAPFIYTLF